MFAIIQPIFDALKPLIFEMGVPQEEWQTGMREIQTELATIALEVMSAEMRGIPLARAVRDHSQFPHLCRMHNGGIDILTLEMPTEFEQFTDRLLAMMHLSPPNMRGFEEGLAGVVNGTASDVERAFARVLLFEFVFVGLVVETWRDRGAMARVGIDDSKFDELADQEVEQLLKHCCAEDLTAPDAINPVKVPVAAALIELGHLVKKARAELAWATGELSELFERRARVEEALSTMNAPDALLIRNDHAEALGHQHLSIESLVSQHPAAFDGGQVDKRKRNRLDQRMKRLRENDDPESLRRKRRALIDIFVDHSRKMED